jgi:hypothetical protein
MGGKFVPEHTQMITASDVGNCDADLVPPELRYTVGETLEKGRGLLRCRAGS